MEGPAELAGGERIDRLLAGEQPTAGQHHPVLAPGPPPGAQQIEQGCRQHGIAVLAPLALLDPDHLALAVDVGELERDHLRGPQAGAVGDRQRRLVLEARCRIQQPCDLLGAQHHGQLVRFADTGHPDRRVVAPQRHAEEEAQARNGGVHAGGRGPGRSHVQLVAPQVLGACLVWRPAEKGGEILDRANVAILSLRRETADRHVVDHALAQRADACIGHEGPPVPR